MNSVEPPSRAELSVRIDDEPPSAQVSPLDRPQTRHDAAYRLGRRFAANEQRDQQVTHDGLRDLHMVQVKKRISLLFKEARCRDVS
jgi:hypothetical protein